MFIIFGAREGMKSFNRFNFVFISSVILMVLCGVSWVNDAVSSENETGEVIVASGDDFVLTQKEVDAYKIFFKNQGIALPPQKEVLIRHLIKGELFANEIRKKQAKTENLDASMDDQKKIEVKLQLTTEYIKKLLEGYKIPEAAVESYYCSHPEKYTSKSLDEKLRIEIRQMIVEAKKQAIIDQSLDGLISKYHIKIND